MNNNIKNIQNTCCENSQLSKISKDKPLHNEYKTIDIRTGLLKKKITITN